MPPMKIPLPLSVRVGNGPAVGRSGHVGQRYLYPELMGLTALESMACGTRDLSIAGALSEFVQNGRTGHVFTSLPELGRFCRDFANNPSKSDRMGVAAKVTVEERFSLPVVGKALWEAYCSIPQ